VLPVLVLVLLAAMALGAGVLLRRRADRRRGRRSLRGSYAPLGRE
jgi:hypothetical protein